MIALVKYSSAVIQGAKRIIKSIGIGGTVMTTKESYPFGFDSQPHEGWTAIFSETSNRDEAVIVGYINKNQLAEAGSSRMYAVGEDGVVRGFIHCRLGGNIELNGSEYSAVRFDPLDSQLQAQKELINAELVKISAAIGLLGGSYIVSPISIDISTAESETIKLK